MKIGKKDYDQIVITDDKDKVIVIISDDEIVEHKGYKVVGSNCGRDKSGSYHCECGHCKGLTN